MTYILVFFQRQYMDCVFSWCPRPLLVEKMFCLMWQHGPTTKFNCFETLPWRASRQKRSAQPWLLQRLSQQPLIGLMWSKPECKVWFSPQTVVAVAGSLLIIQASEVQMLKTGSPRGLGCSGLGPVIQNFIIEMNWLCPNALNASSRKNLSIPDV